jgi:hypothetical protein
VSGGTRPLWHLHQHCTAAVVLLPLLLLLLLLRIWRPLSCWGL